MKTLALAAAFAVTSAFAAQAATVNVAAGDQATLDYFTVAPGATETITFYAENPVELTLSYYFFSNALSIQTAVINVFNQAYALEEVPLTKIWSYAMDDIVGVAVDTFTLAITNNGDFSISSEISYSAVPGSLPAVPLPAGGVLLMSALAGLGYAAKRKSAAVAA